MIVERAEAVVHPRTDGREGAFEYVPAGVELKLGAVVVIGCPHRADDGDVVDAVTDVRPPVADGNAAPPAFFESGLQVVKLLADVTVGVALNMNAKVLQVRGLKDVLVRGLGDGLAGVLV